MTLDQFTVLNVHVKIEPGSHLPVYAQLKEQIKFLILNGDLKPGTKLPATRQLAGFLRIDRNTVLKAYQELERDGLVECRQGRGCVVVEKPTAIARSIFSRLLGIVDRAIDQASELGINYDDFATFSYARAKQRQDVRVKQKLVFIECQAPIAIALAQVVQKRLDIEVTPLILQDLRQPTSKVDKLLNEVDLVVTTFFHIQELRKLLAKTGKEVIALAVKPHLESLIRIAGIPSGTSVALVCVNKSGAEEMKQTLDDSGIRELNVTLCGTDDMKYLAKQLPGHSVVIVSDFIADKVKPMLQINQELIVLDYTCLDEGAINLLRSILDEKRRDL
jgi:GntR family transcriptional regulator